jgi:hypothetical protein
MDQSTNNNTQQQSQLNVQIMPDGVVISIALGPGLAVQQIIPEQLMNDLAGKWLDSRRARKHELQLIEDIKRTKVN